MIWESFPFFCSLYPWICVIYCWNKTVLSFSSIPNFPFLYMFAEKMCSFHKNMVGREFCYINNNFLNPSQLYTKITW